MTLLRRRLPFLLPLLAVPFLMAPPGCSFLNWYREIAGNAGDVDSFGGLVVRNDWNVYVTGSVSQTGSGRDMFVRRYRSWGALQWEVFKQGAGTRDDYGRDVEVSPTGDVLACGRYADTESTAMMWLAALDNDDGSVVWEHELARSMCTELAIDVDGNILLAGDSRGIETNIGNDHLLEKLDTDGNLLWRASMYASDGHDALLSMATDSAGDIYVAGYADINGVDWNNYVADEVSYLAKYNTSGSLVWELFGPPPGPDQKRSIGSGLYVTSGDEVFWTSKSLDGNDALTTTLQRIDPADGSPLWSIVYDDDSAVQGGTLFQDCTGGLTILGNIETSPDYWELHYARYDLDGNLIEEFIEDVIDGERRGGAVSSIGDRVAMGSHFDSVHDGVYSGPDLDIYVTSFNYEPDDCTPLSTALESEEPGPAIPDRAPAPGDDLVDRGPEQPIEIPDSNDVDAEPLTRTRLEGPLGQRDDVEQDAQLEAQAIGGLSGAVQP